MGKSKHYFLKFLVIFTLCSIELFHVRGYSLKLPNKFHSLERLLPDSSLFSKVIESDPLHDNIKEKLLNKFESSTPDIYVSPATLSPLLRSKRYYGLVEKNYFLDVSDNKKYEIIDNKYYDLTIKEETEKPIWQQSFKESFNSRFFQTPLISSIYERGYRQNFENFGFPGIEKEFTEASELFEAVNASVLLDMSCGSGFMSRRFIKSGKYKRIVSADLSRTMLKETRTRILNEDLPLPELVRCDSARLPFASDSFDAIHMGAALHCYPRVEMAIREIYRVLKPGGALYTTTILTGQSALNPQLNSGFNVFSSVKYLTDLFEAGGWTGDGGKVVGRQEGRGCAVLKAVKGGLSTDTYTESELQDKYVRVRKVLGLDPSSRE